MDVGVAAAVLLVPVVFAGMAAVSCAGWLIERAWKAAFRRGAPPRPRAR